MTIQQEAHNLIDALTEDSVRAVVSVMVRMKSGDDVSVNTIDSLDSLSKQDRMKQAYNRVLEIRHRNNRNNSYDTDYEVAREEAVMEALDNDDFPV